MLDPAIFEAEKSGARDLENIHFIDLTDQVCQRMFAGRSTMAR